MFWVFPPPIAMMVPPSIWIEWSEKACRCLSLGSKYSSIWPHSAAHGRCTMGWNYFYRSSILSYLDPDFLLKYISSFQDIKALGMSLKLLRKNLYLNEVKIRHRKSTSSLIKLGISSVCFANLHEYWYNTY